MADKTPQRINILKFIKEDERQFVIPVYQRNYNWQADNQVKRLLDDIYNMHDSKKCHFTGIVMYMEISSGYDFTEISIIDGQQRLTTFFLILWVLREIALKQGDVNQVNKINRYLYNPDDCDEEFRLKLKPLVGDDLVYRKIIEHIESKNI